VSTETPQWRVTFWFLTDAMGWTQLGFAFVGAKSEHHALMLCTQRASRLSFRVDKDTRIEVRPETGDGRL
jgi:hypothetical protein